MGFGIIGSSYFSPSWDVCLLSALTIAGPSLVLCYTVGLEIFER